MATNMSDVSSEGGSRSIRIHFVCLGKSKPEDDCNALLQSAFQALTKAGMSPRWTSERACLSVKSRNRSELFVLPEFVGKVFDHLRSSQCSIVGPGLLLSCLQNAKSIPKTSQPLLSDCMSGIVACCTNIDKPERERIRDRILSMKGQFEASLSSECTVLIATEVGSKKYKAAAKQGTVSVVTPAWIDAAWRRSHMEVFKAKDDAEMLSKFKCPVFKGFTITISNLRNEQRKAVEQLIVDNGGKYSGEMKQGETTHLVTDSTNSQKYTVAKSWKHWSVNIVRTAWIIDSVNKGICLDEDDYLTDGSAAVASPKRSSSTSSRRQQKCSTPASGASTTAGPPFRFVEPNNMTTILPDATNVTVMSNVSMGVTSMSCVNNSEFPTGPVPAIRNVVNGPEGPSENEEMTVTDPNATAAAATDIADNPRSPSPSPAKRLRTFSPCPVTAASNNRVDKDPSVTTPVNAKTSSSRRTSVVPAAADVDDILNQYAAGDVQDPNCSFRPNFDLSEARAHLEQEGLEKKLPVVESPSTIVERNLQAAAEATAAGTSFYNSPSSADSTARFNLAQQLQHVLGRSTLRRRVSNNIISDISSAINSPVTPASVIPPSSGFFTGRQLMLSQDTQEEKLLVDWDDPNQKRERQRVGSLLKKRNEPTQSLLAGFDEVLVAPREMSPQRAENDGDKDDMVNKDAHEAEKSQRKAYIFQLTSLTRNERDRCAEIINKLGGSVILEKPQFDSSCTHLVVASPTRNEKLLAAMASGVWVLHISYLDACDAAGRFIEEAEYEFGTRNMAKVVLDLREEVTKLIKYCPHWRQQVQSSEGIKAFSGWNVFLMADRNREDGYRHILMAGGAVVTRDAHEAKEGAVTHVIVDPSVRKQSAIAKATIDRLLACGAKCYKAEVIFARLAGGAVEDYIHRPSS